MSKLSTEHNYTDRPINLLNAYLCILKENDLYKANMNHHVLAKTKYPIGYLKQMCYVYDAALDSIVVPPFIEDFNENDILRLIDMETLNFDTIDYLNQFGDSFAGVQTANTSI